MTNTEIKPIRMMIYSHDTFGLGHYRRNLLISDYLLKKQPALNILMVTGSPIAGRFSVRGHFDFIKMPSVIKIGVEEYAPRNIVCSYEEIKSCREQILLQSAQHFQPHIFLADHSPVGVKAELIPTLKYLKQNRNRCKVVLGLRDILDEPEVVKRIWTSGNMYQQIQEYYDEIYVYGLRELFDVTVQYDFPQDLAAKTQFCGYIYGGNPKRDPETVKEQYHVTGRPMVLVTVGGGDDGFPILKSYLEMIYKYKNEIQFFTYLVTGPLMKTRERYQLVEMELPEIIKIVEFERDLIGTIVAADLVIGMGGYNSICEILQFAQRAVIVPRIYPRKEQYIRAQILQDRKLLSMLLPTELSPDKLYSLIQSGLNYGVHTQIQKRKLLLQSNGLENLATGLFSNKLTESVSIK